MKTKIIALVLALTGLPSLALAQWAIGPHIVISVPSSDFANVSEVGGGFGVKVIRNLSSPKGFGLRGDFAFLSHGEETQAVQTFSGPFLAQVRQESFRLTFGPQFSLGTGSLRGHVGVLGGFYIFRTNVTLPTGFGGFISGEQDSDAAVGWNFGGGLQYDIGLGPLLDLAVEYQTIYNVTTEFTVEDDMGESETVTNDITAHEITVKLGVIFFLGK